MSEPKNSIRTDDIFYQLRHYDTMAYNIEGLFQVQEDYSSVFTLIHILIHIINAVEVSKKLPLSYVTFNLFQDTLIVKHEDWCMNLISQNRVRCVVLLYQNYATWFLRWEIKVFEMSAASLPEMCVLLWKMWSLLSSVCSCPPNAEWMIQGDDLCCANRQVIWQKWRRTWNPKACGFTFRLLHLCTDCGCNGHVIPFSYNKPGSLCSGYQQHHLVRILCIAYCTDMGDVRSET